MTPSQLKHLKHIDAHLEHLLDIASKRTPGEWYMSQNQHTVYGRHNRNARIATTDDGPADAAFIALCAGNAEAGWKATRAAIACLLVICDPASGADFTNYGGETFLPQILAAFPLETLNPKQP